MCEQLNLTSKCELKVLTLQLGACVSPKYIREISNIKYGLTSDMMIRSNVRPKIKYKVVKK